MQSFRFFFFIIFFTFSITPLFPLYLFLPPPTPLSPTITLSPFQPNFESSKASDFRSASLHFLLHPYHLAHF